jgi:hypothetical protein
LPSGWDLGVSQAHGHWIHQRTLDLVPGAEQAAGVQRLTGADAAFQRGHWIVRSELLRTSFIFPVATASSPSTTLTAVSGFVESRYRFRPRWQVAARLDRLTFSRIHGSLFGGASIPWDAAVSRAEITLGVRAARTLELRGGYQYNWRDGGRTRRLGFPTVQLLYWF